MAEENTGTAGEERDAEGTREKESGTEAQSQEDQALREVEEKARAAGWKPEEEYTGPKGGYVSAQMFLDRGDLYDQLRSQKSEMKRMGKMVEKMATGFNQQLKAQVALRIKELKEDKKAAIVAGDVQAVDQIDAEIASEQQTAKAEADEAPREVSEWVEKNPWFEADSKLKAEAIKHNKAFVATNPDASISESLEATEDFIKWKFKDKFAPPKPKTSPGPVEGSTTPKDTGDKNKYSVKRLSADQKLVYKQMVEQHKVLSHEEYFKGLEEIGELA